MILLVATTLSKVSALDESDIERVKMRAISRLQTRLRGSTGAQCGKGCAFPVLPLHSL